MTLRVIVTSTQVYNFTIETFDCAVTACKPSRTGAGNTTNPTNPTSGGLPHFVVDGGDTPSTDLVELAPPPGADTVGGARGRYTLPLEVACIGLLLTVVGAGLIARDQRLVGRWRTRKLNKSFELEVGHFKFLWLVSNST